MSIVADPSLVWLVGPSGSGKSTWAEQHFRDVEIVSSDRLRSIVGSGPNDLDASAAAFDVLERIATARLRGGLLTVIDTLGFDEELRNRLEESATAAGIPTVAVIFDTSPDVCRARNRMRARPVPAKVLNGQFKRFKRVTIDLAESGWAVIDAERVDVIGEHVAEIASASESASAPPTSRLEFYLHISTFDWMTSPRDFTEVLVAAEESGFTGVSMMDHLVQIPQVGRAWDDILDPFTALAHAAAVTEHLRLGVLVTNVTLRPVAVLAKMLATLDNLSEGRVDCGLGAGWYAAEQSDRGVEFPTDRERLDLLEDTIGALRSFWGPGAKPFEGRSIRIADSGMYPRPIQVRLPIVVGGGGEHRTLQIVARHADGCNLRTGPTLDHKLGVLAGHCAAIGRDMTDLLVTVLDVTMVGADREHTATLVEAHRGSVSSREFRRRTAAGTVQEQIERYRGLMGAGIDRVYVSPLDLDGPDEVRRFGEIIVGL